MPVFSRIVSVILRIGEIAFAAVVAGIIGSYLHAYNNSVENEWPRARWIYTEVVAGLSILLGLIWVIPFSGGFISWPLDLILSLAWFASFGLLVDSLYDINCRGGAFDWGGLLDGGLCDRWKASSAFAFLSAIFWLVSTIVGIWFSWRTRHRAVAGDGVYPRRRWYRTSHV